MAEHTKILQLGYLAAVTKEIRLGAGTIIAPFWNPIRAAGEAALLDVISGGRAEIGIARGAYQFEFDRIAGGMPATDGGRALREIVPVLKKLWEGDYAHDGEIWQFPTTTSVPKPVQQPYPKMWIAARDPDSHDFAISQQCNVMVTPLMKPDEEVLDLVNKFETAVANHPEHSERPEIMVLRHTFMHAESDPNGWRKGAAAIHKFYRAFAAWFANKQTPTNGFLDPLPEADFDDRPEFALEAIRRSAMIGTPAEVIERIRYYQSLGVNEYSYWSDNSLSHEDKKRSLQLFIDEVVPAFSK